MTVRVALIWSWFMAAALLLGCSGGEDPDLPAPAGAASQTGWTQLPARPLVVARADEWAVRGAEQKGDVAESALWTRRAARLRERSWRLWGRDADALEALELYRTAGDQKWSSACDAKVEHAMLQAEQSNDPDEAYRRLYRIKGSATGSCAARVSRALRMLDAYRPRPSVLAELDRAATSAPEASAPSATVGSPSAPAAGRVVAPQTSLEARDSRITNIERYGAKESARVVVFMTHTASFRVGVLEAQAGRGPRIYVDLDHAQYTGKNSFEVGGLVQRVRLGQQGKGTRLVLDLTEPAFHSVFYLPEPFRLIVDVSKTPPAAKPASAGKRRVQRVVLDPGHGGHDPGAVGPAGLREKDVTLDIAHRAAPLLARELGISTLLTRDTDQFVPLAERTARANAFQADLFISIHCNASEEQASSGIMTFILDESKDALAASIAARENAASQAAAAELANVMSRVLGVGSVQESLRFAELLQRAAMASVSERYPGVRDQGVKRAGFYVLAGAQMPSVLYEASFISNPGGEVRLNTGDFRQKMADAIVNAVRAYRDGL